MRALGVDFGFARIGLAVGESKLALAVRPALKASGKLATDAKAIGDVARREQATVVVVGVPLGGKDDRQARICRQLAGHIRDLAFEVIEVNEALSTVEAQSRLANTEWTAAQRRKAIDGQSALIILERFFDEQS
ncbi:MAG: Holliday junction resolvase RuvX [Chthonomonas sp.]|nr:Holliday junction resolvase RuvX [Chthonomonas sp.]